MAVTPTRVVPLGFSAPDFTLPDTVSGNSKSLDELKGEHATVMMFICNHCPFVKHVIEGLVELANDYKDTGISFVAISANDANTHPDDAPERMTEEAARLNFPFPYLYDETQQVARAYAAECTPDFSIFDGDLKCVYRGQLDDSRPGNDIPVSGKDIRAALDAVLAGNSVNDNQRPSIGCNIKWRLN